MFSIDQQHKLLKWAEQLEITDYNQATGVLYDGVESYCCLGIYLINNERIKWFNNMPHIYDINVNGHYRHYGSSYNLHKIHQHELGLDYIYVKNKTYHKIFQYMNDIMHLSFKEIAREIRILVDTGNFSLELQNRLNEYYI